MPAFSPFRSLLATSILGLFVLHQAVLHAEDAKVPRTQPKVAQVAGPREESSTRDGHPVRTLRPSAAAPMLVTDRIFERTGFQEAGPYNPRYDLRSDFVMAYGVGPGMADKLKRWGAAGYVLHVMTGVAWGGYQDYLDGKVDGREHWDEGQVDAAGNPILHGPRVPYMVPTVAFSKYLESEIRHVIDSGAVAIHLEEPEFWARGGFSKAFQREWQIYYNEPWQRPDSSCDAQYRASKLKYYLYRRTLDRLCAAMKEYALVKNGRPVRFYVPTHSLINYAQWSIVSPESSLVDLPGIDGYIAQVWTGTARSPNTYQGRTRERTFETAFLEYGIMQELVRGSGRRMWFLHDPVEDNPAHDWEDYRVNYLRTLVASLLQPDVCRYEISPWPSRVLLGRFPQGSPGAKTIGEDYATVLAVVFNQLRDMDQADISWEKATEGVGVLLADSAMFQRANPAYRAGVAATKDDPLRPSRNEIERLSGFFGLALPVLKHGIPIRPVQLDNLVRSPGYLDRYKVLLLSYEFQKPPHPGIHQVLAEWVARGGTLIYAGADTDPFHQVREWWNATSSPYASPSEHLFERLGLGRSPGEGEYRSGKGLVLIERKHSAWFSRSAQAGERLVGIVRRGVESAGGSWTERNWIRLRRGPYVIAAVLDESVSAEPLELRGRLVDLLDARLAVSNHIVLKPGQQAWLLDLDRVTAKAPAALAAAGRIERWTSAPGSVHYAITSPQGIRTSARILLPMPPKTITVAGRPCAEWVWHEASKTVLIRHAGSADPVEVNVTW
ncbi:MAG: hypothetical protein ACLQNE_33010 [Thermoguttaceae bacterium]